MPQIPSFFSIFQISIHHLKHPDYNGKHTTQKNVNI